MHRGVEGTDSFLFDMGISPVNIQCRKFEINIVVTICVYLCVCVCVFVFLLFFFLLFFFLTK